MTQSQKARKMRPSAVWAPEKVSTVTTAHAIPTLRFVLLEEDVNEDMAPRTLQKAAAYHSFILTQEGRATDTLRNYRSAERLFTEYVSECGQFSGDVPLSELNLDRARGYLVWLRTEHRSTRWGGATVGHGEADVAWHARVLKIWSKLLAREFEMLFPAGDPLAKLRVPKVPVKEPDVLTREQFTLLLDLCLKTREPWRNQAILLFLIDSGSRISELCGLRLDTLTLSRRGEDGQALVFGKGAKERQVGFSPDCSRAIGRYLEMERPKDPPSPWLFLAERRQLTPRTVRALLHALKDRAGIAIRVHPHMFRHTYATIRAEMGANAFQLQQELGHARVEQSVRYVHLSQKRSGYKSPLQHWRKGKP